MAELLARREQAVQEAQEVCQATRDLIRVAEEMRAQFRRAHDTEIRASPSSGWSCLAGDTL
jgi:hypothetical protein